MVFKSLEFELPLFSTVFLVALLFIYLLKEKIQLPENKMFSIILIASFFEALIDTIVHFVCSFNSLNTIITRYYGFIDYMNKILAILFIIIFVSYLNYILMISFDEISKNYKKINNYSICFYVVMFIILQFSSVKIVEVNNVTNVSGSSPMITYIIVGICLFLSLIFSFPKLLSHDRRYYSVLVITFSLGIFMILTLFVPGIIIYDVSLALMCYSMYFTIENPDVKMLEQMEAAKNQADKANRAKTDFLSSMSHEIRTPLNAIVGFSDCIVEATSLDEAKENALDIVNASQTLLEIVNGILDISKIEAGKLEIVNSPYDANSTFLELAKLITPKMNEKGLDFTYNIAPDLPKTLYGDHANIKKIITNLLSNACKYTERGYVHYEVSCVNSNGICKLIISVEDSGRGIKKESVDKLFTKFQRLDEDRNTTIEGTGLGLAITKQLIELMGGRIIVHTVYGEGSKFTVILNQKIEATKVVEKKVKNTLNLSGIKILMVDDTPLNLKVGVKLLEKYGASNIITSPSGFDCLERINNGEVYDIILLDDMMPKMSGVQTLKKLREIPGFKIPTVALTANAISGMRDKYIADGFDDFLAKPIEKEQLITVFNQILGRSATQELPVINDNSERQDEIETLDVVEEEEKTELIPVVDIDTKPSYDNKYLEENGVDINHALELLGDMEMYNMTIKDFVLDVENKWNRIVDYKNKNDMANYAIEVHSLKSDCKYLGFMNLADIAYQHELKSKENDSDFVNNNFTKLEEEYKKVLVVARTYVEHNKISE